ncbi:polysaccharide biosynthesis/export family protein [Reinekea sp.]|uniref:polysaccharide biosynthesis/export family protein n=1 Tax=Reinekea sp. TaxID=1970455 RepID=UPI002A83AF89|nr:polysaccharide biosynthesis/export family protein [Reinekea sp.]
MLLVSVWLSLSSCSQSHALKPARDADQSFYGNPTNPIQPSTVARADDDPRVEGEAVIFASDRSCLGQASHYQAAHYVHYQPLQLDPSIQSTNRQQQQFNHDLPLSPGEIVDIQIEDGEGFAGRHVVNPDGSVQLALLKPIYVVGHGVAHAAEQIGSALVNAGYFQPQSVHVSVRVLHWAPIEVAVSGAVFEAGQVRINDLDPSSVLAEKLNAYGDYTNRRTVVEALRAASGIRPDAKLDQVIIIRNGWQLEVDLSGVLTGESVTQLALIAGDRIVVPTTGCFQQHLVRPSQITPKGFRVFMSNLTVPSEGNGPSGVSSYSSNLPYGTRLLQAVVSANCVGGVQVSNAARKVVLASKNPITGEFQVIERSIELLMKQAHLDAQNPYLMPNDAIACYDSDITNLREAARTLGDVFAPLKLLF